MVLSGEPFGLSVLASGADNHTITAAECFNLSQEEVLRLDKKFSGGHGSPRFETKFIVYGLGYGRGATDIAKQLGRDIAWVEQFIARFRNRLPVYWRWRTNLESHVAKNSYLANPFGRRRWWYTRQVTEMYNFPPSSTAADMMYRILPILERQLPKHASLRLTVHDSVLVHAAKDVAREAARCILDVMQSTWDNIVDHSDNPSEVRKHYPGGWYCPADVHAGLNWRSCKKGDQELEKELGIA
jgi:DNA polymerase I-like protein with 3'-5' exonuclease and polymerase domains